MPCVGVLAQAEFLSRIRLQLRKLLCDTLVKPSHGTTIGDLNNTVWIDSKIF